MQAAIDPDKKKGNKEGSRTSRLETSMPRLETCQESQDSSQDSRTGRLSKVPRYLSTDNPFRHSRIFWSGLETCCSVFGILGYRSSISAQLFGYDSELSSGVKDIATKNYPLAIPCCYLPLCGVHTIFLFVCHG